MLIDDTKLFSERIHAMLSRKLLYPVALAAAAGTPYLVTETDLPQSATEQVQGMFSSESDTSDPAAPTEEDSATVWLGATDFKSEFGHGKRAQHPRNGLHPQLSGQAVSHLGEILRFNVTPQWVTSRWPRVTTVPGEWGLRGLRVPVVTGTRLDDLAGSITYYFDGEQQLQRLSFSGYTGNDQRLVDLITQYYGLQAESTLDAGMYVARWNGHPTSVLRVSRAPVISADSPHAQLQVQLELNRPSARVALSQEFQHILQYDRATQRW
jgi:hypothetical protein